jgi:Zn finger protein HypA/HybF involved in hydrogenase expression
MALGRHRDEQEHTYARGHPLISGETVVPGTYRCLECEHEYLVEEGKVTNLPVCPACQGERWRLGE